MQTPMAPRLALLGALWLAGAEVRPAAAVPHPGRIDTRTRLALPDSLLAGPLPFAPPAPGQAFAVSNLTRKYTRDIAAFLKPEAAARSFDLAQLEAAAAGVHRLEPRPAPADSADLNLTEDPQRRTAEIPPEERDKLVPPTPGVKVGIPSPVATAGALLGGLGLLIKVISELAR